MRKVCSKFVPKSLSNQQKVNRLLISQELLDRRTTEPNFLIDPEIKKKCSQWHIPDLSRLKKCRISKSKIKLILIVFFERYEIVCEKSVQRGQTINLEFF
uniref:Uncharacterized protein n=1 Tax=Strongyloides papillosus TaxID=174720 RepID=A0A0N5B3H8_STREA